MVHLNETLAAASPLRPGPGVLGLSIDLLLANVCKLNVTRFLMRSPDWLKILLGAYGNHAFAGRSEHPEIGPLMRKYFHGITGVATAAA